MRQTQTSNSLVAHGFVSSQVELTKDIYRDLRLPRPDQPTFVDLLKNDSFSSITPKVILDKLHALRIHGNRTAHGEEAKTPSALWLLKEAHDLARWLLVQYGKAKAAIGNQTTLMHQ